MAEEPEPMAEDLEGNLGEVDHDQHFHEPVEPQSEDARRVSDIDMESARVAGPRRSSSIVQGRAMDREVSNAETVIRVKLEEAGNQVANNAFLNQVNQDRRNSSPIVVDSSRPVPYRTLERHNSSPPRLQVQDMSTSRPTFVNLELPSSLASPPVVENLQNLPGPNFCPPCRRSSSPHAPVVDKSRPSFVNMQRRNTSPSGVDSARPSLSVFRFKQPAANSGKTPTRPPRSPSPNRRNTTSDIYSSNVLKPTFNSARRSTHTGKMISPDRNRPVSPRQVSPTRRTSTGDVQSAAAAVAEPLYSSRRRTTTGDISAGKRPGSPLRERESKHRFSRMPNFPGPLGAVVLSWTNMRVTSRDGKVLLDDLSGQVHTGFTAIMGPSGSGKSTLLNTLACRMDKSAHVYGKVRLNGKEYTNTDLKQMSGYVMQDDLLNAHLTVDETLWYTVKLKLEPTFTEDELADKVNTVVKQMGLEHCRRTVIGSPLRKGISGGERKRVAVGMELLTSPQLLFLDEPTSGLDSVTALSLCNLLRDIAEERYCTVVCTIHQPQSRIFNLFQYLIILKAGKLIYQGSAPGVLKFFEESGFPCPEFTNPADHLLDVISHSDKYLLQSNEDKLRSNFVASPVDLDEGADRPLQLNRERMPWHRQYMVLLNRGYKEQYRKMNVVVTQVVQSVITALLIGGVFFQIGNHQKSILRRQPVLFFCVINQGVFGALSVINSFPSERVLILRERAAGMYYSSAYYMAKITAETTVQVISPIVFSIVVYWMVGFQREGGKFFLFMFFMILCQLSATSLALMTSALCRTTDLSVTVLPMVLETNRLFGGFFLAPINLPKYFAWLDALSYVKYCYVAISQSELHDLDLTCTSKELVKGVCPIISGEQTIRTLGLDYITIGDCAGILIVYIVSTRFVAYLGIRFLKS